MRYFVGNIMIKLVIKEIEKIKVIGIKDKVILENNLLFDLWEKFRKVYYIVLNILLLKRVFGICEVIFEIYLVSESMEFNEIIGFEVNSYDVILNLFVLKIIKEGKYVIFIYIGNLDNLDKIYEYIWGIWFLSLKEEFDIRDDFEVYDE